MPFELFYTIGYYFQLNRQSVFRICTVQWDRRHLHALSDPEHGGRLQPRGDEAVVRYGRGGRRERSRGSRKKQSHSPVLRQKTRPVQSQKRAHSCNSGSAPQLPDW